MGCACRLNWFDKLGGAHVLVEVPADIDAIRAADMGLAQAWREHTRALFEEAFARGYMVMWFFSEIAGGARRSHYMLQSDAQGRESAALAKDNV